MSQTKSGQVILIVLVASAVMLTIGLAVASQTVTDVNISSQEQEYARSFNAAEAGIEDLLNQEGGLSALPDLVDCDTFDNSCTDTIGDNTYSYYYEEIGSTGYEVVDPVQNGGVFQLNLDGYGGTSLDVYWASSTVNEGKVPLELSFFYNDNTVYKLAVVPNGGTELCPDLTDFDSSVVVQDPGSFSKREYDWKLNVSNVLIFDPSLQFLRVRPLCAEYTYLAFSPQVGQSFPNQAVVAHVESQSGDNTAAIETEQVAHKFLPSIFDFTVYSGSSFSISN